MKREEKERKWRVMKVCTHRFGIAIVPSLLYSNIVCFSFVGREG
jgi:hypothetical protein